MQIKNCTCKLKILQTWNMNGPTAVRPGRSQVSDQNMISGPLSYRDFRETFLGNYRELGETGPWSSSLILRAQDFSFLICSTIDQFRYIKIQSQTIHLRTRLWGINPTNSVFIPQSLVLRSIVWGWILIYRNWSIPSLYVLYLICR